MKNPIFTGAATAIVTPYRGQTIDYEALKRVLDFQIAGGISGVVVSGTTGENATQPVAEHEQLVDFVVKYVNKRIKVIAGVGSNDTMTSITLATSAAASGVDGIMMVTPYYNKTSQRGLAAHFTYVADRINVPMIVYNVPSRTGIAIAAETYLELSKHPNINGMKEASGDFTVITKALSLYRDELNIWSGNDEHTIPLMSLGAKGVIATCANLIPAEMQKLCTLCAAGDYTGALEIYYKYADLMSALFIDVNPIPVKTALNLMGFDVGDLRLPLVNLSDAHLETLKKSLRAVNLIK